MQCFILLAPLKYSVPLSFFFLSSYFDGCITVHEHLQVDGRVHRIYGDYLRVEQVSVHHSTLDIIQVSVVFQGSLQQSGFLTQLGHMGSVVVGEHLVSQNSVCHLKSTRVKKNTSGKRVIIYTARRCTSNFPANVREKETNEGEKRPAAHASSSFPAAGSAAGLQWVGCSLERPAGRKCTAGSGCTP